MTRTSLTLNPSWPTGGSKAAEHLVRAFSCTTNVTFDQLDEATIRGYIASGEPFGKAGSYGIQGIAGVCSVDCVRAHICVERFCRKRSVKHVRGSNPRLKVACQAFLYKLQTMQRRRAHSHLGLVHPTSRSHVYTCRFFCQGHRRLLLQRHGLPPARLLERSGAAHPGRPPAAVKRVMR